MAKIIKTGDYILAEHNGKKYIQIQNRYDGKDCAWHILGDVLEDSEIISILENSKAETLGQKFILDLSKGNYPIPKIPVKISYEVGAEDDCLTDCPYNITNNTIIFSVGSIGCKLCEFNAGIDIENKVIYCRY